MGNIVGTLLVTIPPNGSGPLFAELVRDNVTIRGESKCQIQLRQRKRVKGFYEPGELAHIFAVGDRMTLKLLGGRGIYVRQWNLWFEEYTNPTDLASLDASHFYKYAQRAKAEFNIQSSRKLTGARRSLGRRQSSGYGANRRQSSGYGGNRQQSFGANYGNSARGYSGSSYSDTGRYADRGRRASLYDDDDTRLNGYGDDDSYGRRRSTRNSNDDEFLSP